MITRRRFVPLVSAAALLPRSAYSHSQIKTGDITVNGDFEFHFENNKLSMTTKDVKLSGITLPTGSWGWIGLAAANGVLSGFGSLVFGAIVDALRGKAPTMEELLQKQLEAIAHLINDALLLHDLKNCQQLVEAYVIRYKEYINQRTLSILQEVLHYTNVALSRLKDHGFGGYQSYMVCAALRMTALQEVVRRGNKGAAPDLKTQEQRAIAFNTKVDEQINLETSVPFLAQRCETLLVYAPSSEKFRVKRGVRCMPVSGTILGKKMPDHGCVFFWVEDSSDLTKQEVDELVQLNTYGIEKQNLSIPPLKWYVRVSLADVRTSLKSENTDIGRRILNVQYASDIPCGVLCDPGLIPTIKFP